MVCTCASAIWSLGAKTSAAAEGHQGAGVLIRSIPPSYSTIQQPVEALEQQQQLQQQQ
jgi:hypothetical protein